jgi:hypothetical protein
MRIAPDRDNNACTTIAIAEHSARLHCRSSFRRRAPQNIGRVVPLRERPEDHPADELVLDVHHWVGCDGRSGQVPVVNPSHPTTTAVNRSDESAARIPAQDWTTRQHTGAHWADCTDGRPRPERIGRAAGHWPDGYEGLKPFGGNTVWVRIPPRAHKPARSEARGSGGRLDRRRVTNTLGSSPLRTPARSAAPAILTCASAVIWCVTRA